MTGIMMLEPSREFVGKQSEYETKDEFIKAVHEEECVDLFAAGVKEGYMRYCPKGTEGSQDEFGIGVGVYSMVTKPAKGTFKVWIG